MQNCQISPLQIFTRCCAGSAAYSLRHVRRYHAGAAFLPGNILYKPIDFIGIMCYLQYTYKKDMLKE